MSGAAEKMALVVEDDPAIRHVLCSYLEHFGLATSPAGDGEEALEYLSGHAPQLVCLDLMLPTFSGYEVCAFIRRTVRLSHIPVLVLSARSLPQDRAHAEAVGASDFLVKPFVRRDLLARVRVLLAAPGHVEGRQHEAQRAPGVATDVEETWALPLAAGGGRP
jgi:DNA-binding response OmpR family regulator